MLATSTYLDLVASGRLSLGAPADICVPSGNFGHAFAALLARRLGVPVRRVLVACNENCALAELIRTGRYRPNAQPLRRTLAPSMDILVASNVERLVLLSFSVCLFSLSARLWCSLSSDCFTSLVAVASSCMLMAQVLVRPRVGGARLQFGTDGQRIGSGPRACRVRSPFAEPFSLFVFGCAAEVCSDSCNEKGRLTCPRLYLRGCVLNLTLTGAPRSVFRCRIHAFSSIVLPFSSVACACRVHSSRSCSIVGGHA